MDVWRDIFVPIWMLWAILAAVAAQRLSELVIARRNTRRLLARGAQEVGGRHYPIIIACHASWMVALAFWVWRYQPALNAAFLVVYLLLQVARVWTMASLGRYWTTRIITVADAPLVRRGPYRYLRHPNYVIVVLEVIVLPLVFGAWPLALVFSLLNAIVLMVRVRVENAVLVERTTV